MQFLDLRMSLPLATGRGQPREHTWTYAIEKSKSSVCPWTKTPKGHGICSARSHQRCVHHGHDLPCQPQGGVKYCIIF